MKDFLAYCKFLLEQRLVIIEELQQDTTIEANNVYITNSRFLLILSIKQDCMGMVTNSQTSKCKWMKIDENKNGSILFPVSVCVQICSWLFLCLSMMLWHNANYLKENS